jgi:DNA-directed RNA polymerase specialized sigma subunit
MDDREQLLNWQKSRDPEEFTKLYIRYQPIINSTVNKFKTTGLPISTLRAMGNAQLIKSFESYKGYKETQPITHIYNNLLKIQRAASESLLSGHIPEARSNKRVTFNIVKENLEDELGRPANNSEIADSLNWNIKEVDRMEAESKGEATASSAPFDFYGNSNVNESKDSVLLSYLYNELHGDEKLVFEYSTGYGGKKMLNNKEIARLMHTNEMAIGRMKRKMAEKIKSYR